jgi:hypothetical protein
MSAESSELRLLDSANAFCSNARVFNWASNFFYRVFLVVSTFLEMLIGALTLKSARLVLTSRGVLSCSFSSGD